MARLVHPLKCALQQARRRWRRRRAAGQRGGDLRRATRGSGAGWTCVCVCACMRTLAPLIKTLSIRRARVGTSDRRKKKERVQTQMRLPNLSSLKLGATGAVYQDDSVPMSRSQIRPDIMATAEHMVEVFESEKPAVRETFLEFWRAPDPLPDPVFPENSTPVYVAIKAPAPWNHRFPLPTGWVPKIVKHDWAWRGQGQPLAHDITSMNDKQMIKLINREMERQQPGKRRFFFQPQFDVQPPNDPSGTYATATFLGFEANEIARVNNDVDALMASRNIEEAHLVFIVVPRDDLQYEDLSIHLDMPTPETDYMPTPETDSPLPNMMAMERSDFVPNARNNFIAPRMILY